VWLASVFSYIGTWVQDVGESWVMLSMSRDPRLVALLTTCFLAPTLALTLPAGLLADRLDRRKLLLWSQGASAVAAAGPALALRLHHMTPGVLLACTALLGAAGALGAPAWQTLVPELLPKERTTEAITLGSIAFNLARVVGPALGGLLLAAAGAEITFVLNAVSFLAVLWVIARYDDVRRASELERTSNHPAPKLVGALADPFRVVWQTPTLRAAFASAGAFGLAACVIMSILPAFAKHSLGASASGYGALLSALGCGAITSGLFLARLRARFAKRTMVSLGIALFGAGAVLASRAAHVAGAVPFFFLAGLGWIACLTTLSASVQLSAPAWTKSSVTALYQLNFYAFGMLGAFAGGAIAEHWSERVAVAASGLMCLAASVVASRALHASSRAALVTGS